MRVHVDGRVYEGDTIDLDGAVSAGAVAAAVRGHHERVRVECPPAGRVHETVGWVGNSEWESLRGALATVARSCGHAVSEDRQRAACRRRLDGLEAPAADLAAARRRVADAAGEEERHRERIAELRGRLTERREAGGDVEAMETRLTDAVADLSEVETELVAARQALSAARDRAREARAVRERRLELEDEAANLARRARARLAAEMREAFADAIDAAPGPTPADPTDADMVTTGLALARLADLRAPVVLDCDRFADVESAAAWLSTPVLRP